VATKDPAGLFVYKNHAWEQIIIGGSKNENADREISDLVIDQFGNVWVWVVYTISNQNDLWRHDGRTWHRHEGVKGPLALDPQKNLLAVDTVFHNESIGRYQFRIASFNGSEFVSKWSGKALAFVWWIFLADIAQDSKGNLWISYYDDRYGDTYGVVCNNTAYNTLDGLAHVMSGVLQQVNPVLSGVLLTAVFQNLREVAG
jgi:hypothetical protein